MPEALLNLLRSFLFNLTPRLDLDCGGSDSDCGGSDCSDCGGSDCSDCNASNCDSGDSNNVAGASSSADISSDSADSSGSCSDRRTRDAGLIGGAAAGAAVAHNRRKKEQRNADNATDEDLANIPRCQRRECRERGKCDCNYGDRPVRIRLRK